MDFRKIVSGRVVQVFNGAGLCIGQQFYADGPVFYETETGDPIKMEDTPLAGQEYHTYDMVQPEAQSNELSAQEPFVNFNFHFYK